MSSYVMFDFDRTLIDTDALKAEQYKRLAKLNNVSVKYIENGMNLYIELISNHLDFNILEFADFMGKKRGIDPSTITKVYLNDTSYVSEFLFHDSLEVLNLLKQNGFKLGIFSQANVIHQKLKIESSGVMHFINSDNIYIFDRKTSNEAVEKLPSNSFFVDDDLDTLRELAEIRKDVRYFWINRKISLEIVTQNITHVTDLKLFCDLVIQSTN